MGHSLLSFNELVDLQKLNQNDFDSVVTNLGFHFLYQKYDKIWKDKRCVYALSKLSKGNPDRIERVEESIHFGGKNKSVFIITLDFIIHERQYYDDLLAECKKDGYVLWGANNYDREYHNIKTMEYRKAAKVAKFSIGKSKENKEFYKVSVSISPK